MNIDQSRIVMKVVNETLSEEAPSCDLPRAEVNKPAREVE